MSSPGHLHVDRKSTLEDLDQLWRPFLLLARALGVFPFTSTKNSTVLWWRNPWNFYSVCCLCAFCSTLFVIIKEKAAKGLSISVVDVNDASTAAFLFQVLIVTSIFIYFLNTKSYLNDLLRLWSSLEFGQVATSIVNARVRRKIRFTLILCAVDVLAGTIALGFGYYSVVKDEFSILSLFLVFSSLWCSIADTVQIGLFCSLCCATTCILKGFCHDLEVELAKGSTNVRLKQFQDLYITIGDFISVFNQLFGFYAGSLICAFVFQSCCNTYAFFSYPYNDILFIPMLFWLLESLSVIFIVCLSAGNVYEQARQPYRILIKIGLSDLPICKQLETLMLLDCFKNLDVYMSMFGIIPITKQALPTIVSFYLSYIFLLYQFPQGSPVASSSHEQFTTAPPVA